jgi:hypothetical protein
MKNMARISPCREVFQFWASRFLACARHWIESRSDEFERDVVEQFAQSPTYGQANTLEQRPLNMDHIERTSCCSSLDLERNFDPNGSKRAPEQRPLSMNHIERISCCSSIIFERVWIQVD